MSAYVAYSAIESHRVSAVVLVVLAFVTHFEYVCAVCSLTSYLESSRVFMMSSIL